MKKGHGILGIWLLCLVFFPAMAQENSSWTDRVLMNADVRYRHEEIKDEASEDEYKYYRTRDRIRARVGLKAEAAPSADLILQMATSEGSEKGGDPISTNQSTTASFSKKPFWLDLAYIDLHPKQVAGLHVMVGKMKNVFFTAGKNQLIWDQDLTPEGVALTYVYRSEDFEPFLNLADFWIEERKEDEDSFLWGAQAGTKLKFNGGASYLTLGGSYYDYPDTNNWPAYGVDSAKFYGNSSSEDGNYLFDFTVVEGFVEFGTKVGKYPLCVYGSYLTNIGYEEDDDLDDSADNVGWLAGVSLGEAKNSMSWAVRYNYRELQKDAVLAAFSDSDFIGGGTNGRGHTIGVDFAVFDNVVLSFTAFLNEKGISGEDADDHKHLEYQRLQFDISAKL